MKEISNLCFGPIQRGIALWQGYPKQRWLWRLEKNLVPSLPRTLRRNIKGNFLWYQGRSQAAYHLGSCSLFEKERQWLRAQKMFWIFIGRTLNFLCALSRLLAGVLRR